MSTQYNDLPAIDKTATVLQQGLTGLLELPAILARVDSLLETLTSVLHTNSAQMTDLTSAVEVQSRLLRHLGEKQECLEHASRQQALLSDQHYAAHVIEPMCRQLFPLVDHIRDALASECQDPGSHQFLRALQSQLLELLGHFGVEPIECAESTAFDPSSMRPVERLETQDSRQLDTVADVIKIGFRRGSTLLRHQSVSVYCTPSPLPSNHISLA